ncbi:hypothetical protein HACA111877_12605 [Halomonas casei]
MAAVALGGWQTRSVSNPMESGLSRSLSVEGSHGLPLVLSECAKNPVLFECGVFRAL